MRKFLIKFLGLEKLFNHVEKSEQTQEYQRLHNKLLYDGMTEEFLKKTRVHATLGRDLHDYANLSYKLGTYNETTHEFFMKAAL